MMRKFVFVVILNVLICLGLSAQTYSSKVWQIGVKDGASSEFALSGKHYSEIPKAFSESAVIYSVGVNDAGDVPYAVPGPADSWAGNPNGTIMVRFGVASLPEKTSMRLVMDFVEVHAGQAPRLEISLNGFRTVAVAPKGSNINYLDNFSTSSKDLQLTVDIPSGNLKEGDNTLMIRTLSGSWMVLDDIRLESVSPVKVVKASSGVSVLGAYSQPGLVYGKSRTELLHPIKIICQRSRLWRCGRMTNRR